MRTHHHRLESPRYNKAHRCARAAHMDGAAAYQMRAVARAPGSGPRCATSAGERSSTGTGSMRARPAPRSGAARSPRPWRSATAAERADAVVVAEELVGASAAAPPTSGTTLPRSTTPGCPEGLSLSSSSFGACPFEEDDDDPVAPGCGRCCEDTAAAAAACVAASRCSRLARFVASAVSDGLGLARTGLVRPSRTHGCR
mmetsp:Transcript_25170/g.100195  ORF Transcript_25170/g.100195 Transcript_25170/m.100195 type:complete len:200 (+) Transcript_25170:238-837(+)